MIDSENQPRSARKRQAILEAAADVFLRSGYLGTSMDEIAAIAAVSKQTVYKHFSDKESLFTELVTATVSEVSDPVATEVRELVHSGDLVADLTALTRGLLAKVMQPRILQLRRLVIGEAGRFPDLARVFYELGPQRTIESLAELFSRLDDLGMFATEDPMLAAEQFNWLVMSSPMNRAMFFDVDSTPPAAELNRHADAGVAVFLAAYRHG